MLSKHQKPQKFIAYFELREALQQEGCPICSLLIKRSTALLDGLLYEQVTDSGTRVRLRQAHGLCNWHAWMLTQVVTGRSGVAIIYEDLLRHQLAALRSSLRMLRPRSVLQRLRDRCRRLLPLPLLAQWSQRKPCPVCYQLQEVDEAGYLHTLLDFLTEPDFAQDFQRSFGLCLPHLLRTIERERDHPALATLVQGETEKLGKLQQELQEFLRKFDYRFATASCGEEGSSWQRAIELFVGKPWVFGNDRCWYEHRGHN